MDYRAAYSCRSNAQRDGDRLGGMCRRVMDTGGAVMKEYKWGPWKVRNNPMSEEPFEVYQKRDDGEPMHGGNCRIHSAWESREAAQEVADKLNREEQI